MGNEVKNNKFTWVIKKFSSLESKTIVSDDFVIGGCKWFLSVYPKGEKEDNYLSLNLYVAELKSLPSGWRRHAKYSVMIVNQIPGKFSLHIESTNWFEEKSTGWGFQNMFSRNQLKAKDSGFLVNGDLKIVVEIEVLEAVGPLDVPKDTSSVNESIDINGFHVLPSQVELVKCIFDKHPDIAAGFQPKNQLLRTSFMNIILTLTETLRKPLQELTYDDLVEAETALTCVKGSGFKVDWLEQKLDEVKKKKIEEEVAETRVQELDKELKECKRKRSEIEDIEAQLEKEKAKVLAARTLLTRDDFV